MKDASDSLSFLSLLFLYICFTVCKATSLKIIQTKYYKLIVNWPNFDWYLKLLRWILFRSGKSLIIIKLSSLKVGGKLRHSDLVSWDLSDGFWLSLNNRFVSQQFLSHVFKKQNRFIFLRVLLLWNEFKILLHNKKGQFNWLKSNGKIATYRFFSLTVIFKNLIF